MGADAEVRGATAVAGTFSGRALVADWRSSTGSVGALWIADGPPRVVFAFTVSEGRIVRIELFTDPARLAALDLALL
jgi:RNA polymerase sigma-70 factor (ECF subfamily)